MNDPAAAIHDDALVGAAKEALRFRYRAFLAMVVALGVCVSVELINQGSLFSKVTIMFVGIFAGIGVPWLLWHLRVPFTARVAMPMLALGSQVLNGQDPRENLITLASGPVSIFLIGWCIDVCLRQDDRRWSFAGRFLFSAFWVYIAWYSYLDTATNPEYWIDVVNVTIGTVIVWLPKESLAPAKYRLSGAIEPIVTKGLQSAGAWIANRTAIAVLIILPSVIYLDLLDFPPLLRAEMEASGAVVGEGDARSILYWKREARAFKEDDLGNGGIEVHVAPAGKSGAVIDQIRLLRADPVNEDIAQTLASLSDRKVTTLEELGGLKDEETAYYLDRLASGDERVTAGVLSSGDPALAKWVELRPLSNAELSRIEREVGRATFAILANGILILLLLGGPSGGVPAAWWLAILLAGMNLQWVGESLGMGLDRARFVMWREYADGKMGGALFSVHSLVVFFIRTAEWLTSTGVSYAGIWVALCWPGRTVSPARSRFVRFWRQTVKVALVTSLFWLAALSLVWATKSVPDFKIFFGPMFLLPALFATGRWKRRCLKRDGTPLPTAGKMAISALLLLASIPILRQSGVIFPGPLGLWFGYAAVVLSVVLPVLLMIALERGSFLSPPHVEGQVWLVGVAAIPFLENVVGEPVSRFIQESGLFLGTTVGWLAFAAAIWVIGPILGFFGKWLACWSARGLDRIEELHGSLKEGVCSRGMCDVGEPLSLCTSLFESLGIRQPELWRHLRGGFFERLIPSSEADSKEKLISRSLAEALGEVHGSLRLEEMRLEWKWAPFHPELDQWFKKGGDLLLIPASYEGYLLGIFCAPDLPENRFLLRPAVSGALGETLATAILLSAGRSKESALAPGR